MTVFDLSEKQGVWFDMEGGGRVQFLSIGTEDWKVIRQQTVKKKVEYKRIDGKAERFDVEEVDNDLQNELFWDRVIVSWENFFDEGENPIPCTKANKILLLTRSVKFANFASDCLNRMTADEAATKEQLSKN